MKVFKAVLLAGLLALVGGSAAFAGGSGVYPNGAEGFWMGAAPPPGVYYLNYDLWYSAHAYNDADGDEYDAGPFAGFTIDVFANVSRVLWISDYQILGANWGSHIFIVYQDVNVKTSFGNAHVSGLADTIIDPFILAWHSPNLHVVTGVDIYVPTGDYDAGREANLGANAFVYEPVLAVTYMFPQVKGLAASAKFMYDIPETNHDFTHPVLGVSGDLKYGQEFHFDYSLDYMVTEELKAGIGGYFYKQTTNDELNGSDIHGNMGRVWAIGPGVEYSKGRFIVSWRTQFEIEAENRPQGIANWLKLVYVL